MAKCETPGLEELGLSSADHPPLAPWGLTRVCSGSRGASQGQRCQEGEREQHQRCITS